MVVPVSVRASSSPSDIRVIVVGCGFAGLACAIESRLKGHSVLILEKKTSLETLGEWHESYSNNKLDTSDVTTDKAMCVPSASGPSHS